MHFNVTAHPISDGTYRAVLEFLARTGGATTVELAHQVLERPGQSKSSKLAGLASDWADRSCFVAEGLTTNSQGQPEVLGERRRTRKERTRLRNTLTLDLTFPLFFAPSYFSGPVITASNSSWAGSNIEGILLPPTWRRIVLVHSLDSLPALWIDPEPGCRTRCQVDETAVITNRPVPEQTRQQC